MSTGGGHDPSAVPPVASAARDSESSSAPSAGEGVPGGGGHDPSAVPPVASAARSRVSSYVVPAVPAATGGRREQATTSPALAARDVFFGAPQESRGGATSIVPRRLHLLARQRMQRLGGLLASLAGLTLVPVASGLLPAALVLPLLGTVVVSAGLVVVARTRRLRPETVLRLGLVALVFYCMLFSFLVAETRLREYGVPGDATWTCVLLVAFPLLVPAHPRESAIALGLGALTAPLGILWLAGRYDTFSVTAPELVGFSLSPLAAAVIGAMGARFVYRLGMDVERATELGNYRLVRRIGAGGMGEVWEARHARLARPAAIKFIGGSEGEGGVDEVTLRRFVREASLTASLRSPHTVEVFDFGLAEDGRLYYAMELLEGVDLDALVEREGPLPPMRALHLLLQALRSLEEAHARGLVHRDIKPANIFVCRYGLEEDFVKVLDFGLVREMGAADSQRLTKEHHIQGTPAYLPPESAWGEEIGPEGDLYAMACVFWWTLCGRPPFEGATTMAQLFAHAHDDPGPLGEACPVPLPASLEELVAQALQKRPADRVRSASEFIVRVEAILRELTPG